MAVVTRHADATPSWLADALAQVVDRATRNVADGGGPFAARVLRDGEVIAEGVNRVTRDRDPTAHAEVVAIRAAAQTLGTHSLAGCHLVASCEPCPLCLAASMWARVDTVIYAADRHDAAAAGFDDRTFYEMFDRPRDTWDVTVRQQTMADAQRPFAAWLADTHRVAY